jgi:endonuclease YncB( thermonuclease family)
VSDAGADETPVPGSVPAVKASPPPARRAVSARPVSVPTKSHGMRNLCAIVLGLGGAAAALYFAGVRLPKWTWEPAEKAAKKEEAKAEKPAEREKQPVARPPDEKPPDREPLKPVDPPKPKPPPVEPAPDLSNVEQFEVVKVEDGGTVIVKGPARNIAVHLLGVKVAKPGDAPVHGLRSGSESADWLKARLKKGQKVYLYYGILDSPRWRAERDAYGSDRAWVFRVGDEEFVNLAMVKEGYARVNPDSAKEFLELFEYWEEKARGQ